VFQHSEQRRFDLLAGADGLHSKVRSIVFGEEASFVHHLGYVVSIFTIPNYLHFDHAGLY
jgi:2-polyprenyl-6-methoxyphenol hydroxylase-like FAD-dependent oxidoreductase